MNEKILEIINKWANQLCVDVYAEWARQKCVEGKAEIDFRIIENTVDLIVGQFKATGQKAWICEYGKGSLMKPANLSKYKKTKYWNKFRKGTAISGREKGKYLDLDNQEHESSGKNKGRNLELSKIPAYQPILPRDIIHKIVFDHNSWYWISMNKEIKKAVKHYMISVINPKRKFTLKV